MSLKGIKRLVSYGLISLTGFNLFVGCENPYEQPILVVENEYGDLSSFSGNQISSKISFTFDTALYPSDNST